MRPRSNYALNTCTLAMTGASGAWYGLNLLEQLIKAQQTVYLLISDAARLVIPLETGLELPTTPEEIQQLLSDRYQAAPTQLQVLGLTQWTSPLASGSAAPPAMVICPCTSGTLSAIANGFSRNLIERAAEVVLKEQHQLIIVHRETPLSVIHLENMLRLARAGALILPASPGFYHQPQTVNAVIDFIVARILDQLGIEHDLWPRWGLTPSQPPP